MAMCFVNRIVGARPSLRTGRLMPRHTSDRSRAQGSHSSRCSCRASLPFAPCRQVLQEQRWQYLRSILRWPLPTPRRPWSPIKAW